MTLDISRWVRPQIREISSYHVPDPGQAIKLDAMENPYGWDAQVTEEWLKELQHAAMNRYPNPAAPEVKAVLRDLMDIPADSEIILGNGSDELIQMLILTLNAPGQVLLSVEPSFVMYRLLAQIAGMEYQAVPLRADDFSLDIDAVLAAIKQHQPALTFLAYPNNPTGNVFAKEDIEAVLEASEGVVVVDEAYCPFTDHSFLPRVTEYPNLLIMRTISKMGLAGLRLGLLVGHPLWLQEIDKTRLPYNINVLSQMTTVFALQHHAEMFERQTQAIREQRAVMQSELQALDKVQKIWESETNFVLFRIPQAREVFEGLKQRNVLIKCLAGSHPLLEDCLRVTVGTPEENQAFLQALKEL